MGMQPALSNPAAADRPTPPPHAPGRDRAGRFQPGQSGNPAGRPRGARNRTSVLADLMTEDDAAHLVRVVLDQAMAGDAVAARFCLSRLVATPRAPGRFIELDLLGPDGTGDAAAAYDRTLAAVGRGELSIEDGRDVIAMLAQKARVLAGDRSDGVGEAQALPAAEPESGPEPDRPAPTLAPAISGAIPGAAPGASEDEPDAPSALELSPAPQADYASDGDGAVEGGSATSEDHREDAGAPRVIQHHQPEPPHGSHARIVVPFERRAEASAPGGDAAPTRLDEICASSPLSSPAA